MGEGIVTTEAAAATVTEPVSTPEPGSLPLAEFVHKQYEQHAAAESVTEEPKAPEAAVAAAATPEAKTDPPAAPVVADEQPFSPEQLRDRAHWDSLDKAGWARAEKLHPVETARVKAGYAAASRIAEDARRTAATAAAEPPKPEAAKVDPYDEALQKTDSLDPAERAEGFRTLARLEAQKLLGEIGLDPAETQASSVERKAYAFAVNSIPQEQRAEFVAIPMSELDAVVEADPELMDDLDFALKLKGDHQMRALGKLVKRAGQIVLSNKAAAKIASDAEAARVASEAKAAETQKRLKSNQSNASTTVVDTPGGKSPRGEKTIEETIHEKVAALK